MFVRSVLFSVVFCFSTALFAQSGKVRSSDLQPLQPITQVNFQTDRDNNAHRYTKSKDIKETHQAEPQLPVFPEESLTRESIVQAKPFKHKPVTQEPVEKPVEQKDVVLGQTTASMSEVDAILKEPLPHPQGAIDSAAIDQRLLTTPADTDLFSAPTETAGTSSSVSGTTANPVGASNPDQFAYGTLLIAVIATTVGLIYMVFVAYDYRQRWMQTLTSQNERFSMNDYETEGDEMLYGTLSYV